MAEPPQSTNDATNDITYDLVKLRDILARSTHGEMGVFCFDLQTTYDDIVGEGKTVPAAARAIVQYFEARERIPDLVARVRREFPLQDWAAVIRPRFTSQRQRELQYLEQLRTQGVNENGTYTPLAGEALVRDATQRPRRAKPMIERPEMKHTPWSREMQQPREPRRFSDAVSEILNIRRLVLLGEPGAGKTTTLWKLADHLIEQALSNPCCIWRAAPACSR